MTQTGFLINQLSPPPGSSKKRKRRGRGESSGLGKTAGRGHKGQKARAGGFHKTGFEGGQMPLQRRLPKRGFRPLEHKVFEVFPVSALAVLGSNALVTVDLLKEKGWIKKSTLLVKILGGGDLGVPLKVKGIACSQTARAKIEKAGGEIVDQ